MDWARLWHFLHGGMEAVLVFEDGRGISTLGRWKREKVTTGGVAFSFSMIEGGRDAAAVDVSFS